MAKKPSISTITSGYTSTTTLNANFEALRNGFDNTLSLDGSTPNAMNADFDMNSNDILNANEVNASALRLGGVLVNASNLNAAGATLYSDNYIGDGSTVAYTMSYQPFIKDNTQVYIDGVYQNKAGYETSGTTLTFSEAPPLNSNIEIVVARSLDVAGTSSANVDYDQGDSGSVTRTVEAKLQEFVSVKDFGAVGDGVTDDTAAIQAAIDAVSLSSGLLIANDGTYLISSELNSVFPDFSNTHIDFRGAFFEASHDGVAFNFNPSVNWSSLTSKRDITISGGAFDNTNVSKTSSVGFQMFARRIATIKDAFFRGWHKAIEIQGKDTYAIKDTFFRNNVYGIYCPSGLVQANGDVLINLLISNVHHSEDSSISEGPIYIDDRVIGLRLESGSINGSPLTRAQVYHANNSAASPLKTSRNIMVVGYHFEQVGQYGAIDLQGNTGGIQNVVIKESDFQQVYSGASRLMRFENVDGLTIENCWFETGLGTLNGILLDADCKDVNIALTNNWVGSWTNKINLNGCPRSEVTIGTGKRMFTPEALTGFDANTWTTSSGAVNVDSLWSNYSDLWLYPKGYIVKLVASDSGSASGTASAAIFKGGAASATPENSIKVDLSGLPNGTEVSTEGFVEANNLGRLSYDFVSTGSNTLTVSVVIVGVIE